MYVEVHTLNTIRKLSYHLTHPVNQNGRIVSETEIFKDCHSMNAEARIANIEFQYKEC